MITDPWLLTASGRRFPLLNPQPEDVKLQDIAHALGHLARFNGHTSRPYTVAEHCVLVALILREQGHDKTAQLLGLLHDAAEAYIGDVPTPIKWAMNAVGGPFTEGTFAFRYVERGVQQAILAAFGLHGYSLAGPIKEADTIALATESRDLLPGSLQWPGELPTPYGHNVEIAMLWAQWLYTHNLEEVLKPADLYLAVFAALMRGEG